MGVLCSIIQPKDSEAEKNPVRNLTELLTGYSCLRKKLNKLGILNIILSKELYRFSDLRLRTVSL